MCGLGSAMVSSSNLPAYISNDSLRTLSSFSLSLPLSSPSPSPLSLSNDNVQQCRRDRKVAGSQVDQPGLTSSANFLPKNLRRCFQGPQVFNFLITVKIIHFNPSLSDYLIILPSGFPLPRHWHDHLARGQVLYLIHKELFLYTAIWDSLDLRCFAGL